jgi:ankyrin repeat protein
MNKANPTRSFIMRSGLDLRNVQFERDPTERGSIRVSFEGRLVAKVDEVALSLKAISDCKRVTLQGSGEAVWIRESKELITALVKAPPSSIGGDVIHFVAGTGSRRLIKRLIDCGADIHRLSRVPKMTPAMVAVECGRVEMATFLLDHGAHLAPSWIACYRSNKIVKQLLFHPSLRADLNSPDANGRTALYWVANRGMRGMPTRLVEAGADPNFLDCEGATALHAAAEYCAKNEDSYELLDELARLGIDPDARDYRGRNALHYAQRGVDSGATTVRRLLEMGASPHALTDEGNSPLHITANCMSSLALLLEYGGDPNHKNEEGFTPLGVAEQAETIGALIRAGGRWDKAIPGDENALRKLKKMINKVKPELIANGFSIDELLKAAGDDDELRAIITTTDPAPGPSSGSWLY